MNCQNRLTKTEDQKVKKIFGEQFLQQRSWDLSNGKLTQNIQIEKVKEIYNLSFVECLLLGHNPLSETLVMFVHIDFSSLKELSLQKLQIKNIQSLQFLQSPLLQYLNLEENPITNIQSMSKTKFPKLEVIKLSIDRISQNWERFYKGQLGSLKKLEVRTFYSPLSCAFNSKIYCLVKNSKPPDRWDRFADQMYVSRKFEKCMFPLKELVKNRNQRNLSLKLLVPKELHGKGKVHS